MNDIDTMAEAIKAWADATFPDRTDASMWLKVYEEIGETIRSGGDPMEVADLFVLLLDYAKRKDIDIGKAVAKKMIINMTRDWVVDPNTGVMHHEGKSYD